jgi:hypothetical protein
MATRFGLSLDDRISRDFEREPGPRGTASAYRHRTPEQRKAALRISFGAWECTACGGQGSCECRCSKCNELSALSVCESCEQEAA